MTNATQAKPAFAVGDLIGVDTKVTRYRVYKVAGVDLPGQQYIADPVQGGPSLPVPFHLAFPDGQEPPSHRRLAPGTLIRYTGKQTNLAVKPGGYGTVVADKFNDRNDVMIANVWPLGGGNGINYCRLPHSSFVVVPWTPELAAALDAAVNGTAG